MWWKSLAARSRSSERARSSNDAFSERGFLGLAFNKDYVTNGRFYVYYTSKAFAGAGIASGDVVLAEYTRSAADPDVANPTGTVLLSQPHPRGNHNGGWLATGPDGMLYMGIGDGGSGGDPDEAGQSLMTFAGKILRLDVSAAGSYAIPADNPFAGMGGGVKEEIFLYGLRNPWRNSFDRQTGDLYIGDVGQNYMEEVDVIPTSSMGGENLGWDVMEGSSCFHDDDNSPSEAEWRMPLANCDMTGKTMPVFEYLHGNNGDASITGGYVYRGCKMPDLSGTYFYADVVLSYVKSFKWDGAGGHTAETDYPQFDGRVIYGFGEDADGELLLLDGVDGHMYRLVPM
jgi:glucose/arabinose dehydrogenase